jgi:integrase
VVPTIGALPLRSLTRAQLRSLYADLADHGGRGKRPLSAKSVHNVSLMLSRAFGDAVEDRIIDSNPGARAHKLPSGRRDMKTWTGDQVHAFLGSVARDRLAGLWRLAFSSGMRRGELLGLRWSDLDLDGATLSVQQTRIRGAEGLVYGSPKTAKGRRRIALDAATVVALRAHRRAQAAERLLAGSIWHDEDLVFCRADGQPLDPDSVSQSFERLSARAGLPRIRLHDARHTAASLLLAAGVHPKVVQERLGHATIATTLDTYSQVLPGLGEDAAERLAAAIDGAR